MLQETFRKGRDVNQRISRLGLGYMSEMDQILHVILVAIDFLSGYNQATKKQQTYIYEAKECAGMKLVATASIEDLKKLTRKEENTLKRLNAN